MHEQGWNKSGGHRSICQVLKRWRKMMKNDLSPEVCREECLTFLRRSSRGASQVSLSSFTCSRSLLLVVGLFVLVGLFVGFVSQKKKRPTRSKRDLLQCKRDLLEVDHWCFLPLFAKGKRDLLQVKETHHK